LPDFKPTPVSQKLMDNLFLAAQAKLRLAQDERTREAELQVQANNGKLTVTFPPHQEAVGKDIPRVLSDLAECRGIQCTMAETNILWVQERFEPASDNFQQIIRLSQRWGAAVELMRLIPPGEQPAPTEAEAQAPGLENGFGRQESACAYDGGVEDDDPVVEGNDGGLRKTEEELVGLGRYGGRHTVCGGYDKILERAQGRGHYALVVVGDMFLSKGHSTRTRRTRELAMSIRDRLKAPVITADELKTRFLFGKRQALTLAGFTALLVFIYGLIFSFQEPVLSFLGGPLHEKLKWLCPIAVALFVPAIAYLYGTATGLAFKIINID
jgi:hypothetical protein